MKAHDLVLKTLIELDGHQGDFFNLKSSLEYAHPDLSQDEIADILDRLKKMKLISTPTYKMKGSALFIKVNPGAYIYFQNKAERESAETAAIEDAKAEALSEIEDWEERSWNYKMLLIGFIAGLVSGVALMWLNANFFK